MVQNALDLDRYLKRGYPVTVVEYIGRGHEHFSDEVQNIFDWMERYKRNFYPKEFTTKSMRPWDNFFWWVELSQMPPKSMVLPTDWPPVGGRTVETTARVTEGNSIWVTSGAGHVTVWLTPEMLNFDEPVTITINGQRATTAARTETGGQSASERRNRPARLRFVEPDLETLLEDCANAWRPTPSLLGQGRRLERFHFGCSRSRQTLEGSQKAKLLRVRLRQ